MTEPNPPLVEQPTAAPTNKTLTFLGGSVATGAVLKVLEYYDLMEWLGTDAGLLREFVFLATSGAIGLVAAYFKRDRANAGPTVRTPWLIGVLLLFVFLAGCAQATNALTTAERLRASHCATSSADQRRADRAALGINQGVVCYPGEFGYAPDLDGGPR